MKKTQCKILIYSLVAVCVLFCLEKAVSAQNKTVDFAELERTIEAELKDAKTPGAAVAIIKDDKIVFAKGFGTTSAENGNQITPDTLFRMGSTTKMFTAAALVSLAERTLPARRASLEGRNTLSA